MNAENPRILTPHQLEVEEAAGMPRDWGLQAAYMQGRQEAIRDYADLSTKCPDVNQAALICDCCGCAVSYVRQSAWHGPDSICKPCFFIWYEDGLTAIEDIKARRLRIYGTEDTQKPKGLSDA